ncbi:MAG: 30S ribosomal protein S16 [Acholeplasmatales bacterium]|nr:MAG: 30S ribosomal protein S16 [Acholeplasmatales bacterium]
MALKLRLQRHGTTKRPFYRLVAAESSHKRDGRYLEIIGTYDPTKNPTELNIDEARALAWLAKGAQPTDTAKNLLTKKGIIAKFRQTPQK